MLRQRIAGEKRLVISRVRERLHVSLARSLLVLCSITPALDRHT
jgi:hypothetical protein